MRCLVVYIVLGLLILVLCAPVMVHVFFASVNADLYFGISLGFLHIGKVTYQKRMDLEDAVHWALDRSVDTVVGRIREIRTVFVKHLTRILGQRTLINIGYMMLTGLPPSQSSSLEQAKALSKELFRKSPEHLTSFDLELVIGLNDAAYTAYSYAVFAALGAGLKGYLIDHSKAIDPRICVTAEFTDPQFTMDLDCIFRLVPGHIILVALANLVKALFRKGANWIWTETLSTP